MMIPATAATQNVGRAAFEVIQREFGAALTDDKNHRCNHRNHQELNCQCPVLRHGDEIDREHERPNQDHREDAAEVIHLLGGLIDMRRNIAQCQENCHNRERDDNEENPGPGRKMQDHTSQ